MKLLSLGAGVQSTTALLPSIEGTLPKLDATIFADSGWDPAAVSHLDRTSSAAEAAGIPLHRVCNGDLRPDAGDPPVEAEVVDLRARRIESGADL